MSPTVEESPRQEPEGRLGESHGPTHRQIVTVLSGLMLGVFLSALDQTIVSAAVRVIADQLHGQTAQAWVTTAYLVTATITTLLYGKLSDIYGRKPLYVVAIGLFLVGSLLCGVAGSIYELAVYRAIQGLGGGGLLSLALTIIADLVPPRQGGRYQGFFMAAFGMASVLGPVVGGLFAGMDSLLGVAGWRWVFLINVPISAIALVVVSKVLNVRTERVAHRIDYGGAASLIVLLLPLLTVAEQGRDWGWGSPLAVGAYALSLVGLMLFLVCEHKLGEEAMLPLRMFRRAEFRMGNVLMFVVAVGMFGGVASIPLYLQIVQGLSPAQAGMMLLPMTVGVLISTAVAGRLIVRTGRLKPFLIVGTAVMSTALFLFGTVRVDSSLWRIGATAMVLGAGVGLLMQTLTLLVQSSATQTDRGVATAAVNLFRQTGGTMGSAVFLSILFSTVGGRIAEAIRSAAGGPAFTSALQDPAVRADPRNAPILDAVHGGELNLNDTSFLNSADPRLARPVLEGFSGAMDVVFLVGAIVMLLAFATTWFLRDTRLD